MEELFDLIEDLSTACLVGLLGLRPTKPVPSLPETRSVPVPAVVPVPEREGLLSGTTTFTGTVTEASHKT